MRPTYLLPTLLLLVASSAAADPPYTMSDPIRFARSGGAVFSPVTIVGTTSRWARPEPDATVPLCVAWDTQVVLSVGGEMSCVWVQTTTITLGAQDGPNASYITDDYGWDGNGPVVYLPAAGAFDTIPMLATVSKTPGSRGGVCTGPISYGRDLALVYPPCRVDGDCADAGGSGTCTTSPTDAQRLRSCAFLVCRASAADTQLTVMIQR